VKLVHLVGSITKKFVTMHGHMNLKNTIPTELCCFWFVSLFLLVRHRLNKAIK